MAAFSPTSSSSQAWSNVPNKPCSRVLLFAFVAYGLGLYTGLSAWHATKLSAPKTAEGGDLRSLEVQDMLGDFPSPMSHTGRLQSTGSRGSSSSSSSSYRKQREGPLMADADGAMYVDSNILEDTNELYEEFPRVFKIPNDTHCVPAKPADFTIVTQTSPERIWMLNSFCERWGGPIVASVYVPDVQVYEKELKRLKECPRMQVVALYEDNQTPNPSGFPINHLRNMAIRLVKTSHYILVDVDLWPDRLLYKHLLDLAQQVPDKLADPRQALVVPAFEVRRDSPKESPYRLKLPTDQRTLRQCIYEAHCDVFYRKLFHQSSTNYTTYFRQTKLEFQDVPCFKSPKYEPYVVIRNCHTTPMYSEAFSGYGKNKIQQITHMRYLGFKFSVLSEGFLIHYPHKGTRASGQWGKKGPHFQKTEGLYGLFEAWLRRMYPEGQPTKMCPMKTIIRPLNELFEEEGSARGTGTTGREQPDQEAEGTEEGTAPEEEEE